MKEILQIFMSQPWYAIACEISVLCNLVTMFVSEPWARNHCVVRWFISTINLLALNIFKNENRYR